MGKLDSSPTLVRVHTENLLSDVFHAKDLGSHRSLLTSLQQVAQAGHGAIVYMEQTGRMQETLLSAGQPAAGPNLRDYGTGAQILTALGLRKSACSSIPPAVWWVGGLWPRDCGAGASMIIFDFRFSIFDRDLHCRPGIQGMRLVTQSEIRNRKSKIQ